ncbi:MAG: hypothetical protein ACE5IP_03730 [Terriglobia bacterium]
MRAQRTAHSLLILALAVVSVGCRGEGARDELERLRRENAELRARAARTDPERAESVSTPDSVLAHFAEDPASGTLAGLVPGDTLAEARAAFGAETRTRSWRSEGRRVHQYEWELEAGVSIRLNANSQERLQKIAVVFADPAGINIPTLAGLTLGRETYQSIEERYGPALKVDPQLWGARGLYTVAQRTPLERNGWRLEFVYEMPAGLSQAHLEQIGEVLQRERNPAVLEPHLRDRAPFLVALEEAP